MSLSTRWRFKLSRQSGAVTAFWQRNPAGRLYSLATLYRRMAHPQHASYPDHLEKAP